jgi:Tn3 transposase DDE domain-containing protein
MGRKSGPSLSSPIRGSDSNGEKNNDLYRDCCSDYKKQEEELRNQAGCLNLVINAVVTWNTVYMAAVIDQLRAEGRTVNEEDIARLSPARYEHINPYGKYRFEVEEGLSRSRLRPLRQPNEQPSR